MTWTKLCRADDLAPGRSRVFEACGVRLAAARSGDAVFVLEDRCSHDDGALGDGALGGATGDEIECPRHGARFDVRTGRATRMPAATPIRTYTAKIVGGDVLVDLPEDEA